MGFLNFTLIFSFLSYVERRQEYGSVKTEPALPGKSFFSFIHFLFFIFCGDIGFISSFADSIPGGPPRGLYHGQPPSTSKYSPAKMTNLR